MGFRLAWWCVWVILFDIHCICDILCTYIFDISHDHCAIASFTNEKLVRAVCLNCSLSLLKCKRCQSSTLSQCKGASLKLWSIRSFRSNYDGFFMKHETHDFNPHISNAQETYTGMMGRFIQRISGLLDSICEIWHFSKQSSKRNFDILAISTSLPCEPSAALLTHKNIFVVPSMALNRV